MTALDEEQQAAVEAIDLDRLGKLLGMLGSEHDGEVVNAGRMAAALIREAGMTWTEVLRPEDTVAVAAARALLAENDQLRDEIHQLKSRPRLLPWQEPENSDDALDLCILWSHRLSPWEQQFVDSVQHRSQLSDRQRETIWNIAEKIGRMARTGI
jgi:hypothetical protein